jgi:hypothetical protein
VVTGSLSHLAQAQPDLWRRYVEAILDGFTCHDADRTGMAVPPAPTEDEFEAIISCTA